MLFFLISCFVLLVILVWANKPKKKYKPTVDGWEEVDCSECNGTGKTPEQECPICRGKGILPNGNRCGICKGVGVVPKSTCWACGGSGKLLEKKL